MTHPERNDGGYPTAVTSPGGDRAERAIDRETAAEIAIPGMEDDGTYTTPTPEPRRRRKPRKAPPPASIALFEIDDPTEMSNSQIHR